MTQDIPRDLILPLKRVYFEQIKAGVKPYEFRLTTPFWQRRIEGRTYRNVILTLGYPKGGGIEGETRLTRKWNGYEVRKLAHDHFGPELVHVYSIDVKEPAHDQEG
jgi:hypothetical protein